MECKKRRINLLSFFSFITSYEQSSYALMKGRKKQRKTEINHQTIYIYIHNFVTDS